MRRRAFVVFILGMAVLSFYFIKQPVETSIEKLDELELNTRLIVSGRVTSEKVIYLGTNLLEIDNFIQVVCTSCREKLLGKNIKVIGRVSNYKGKKQITAEKIILALP